MNFFEHLEEFRKRILHAVLFFFIAFILLWFLKDDLLNLYLLTINNVLKENESSIILLKITDKFFIHLKTVFFFAVMITFPFIYFEAWQFIKPALLSNEKKYFMIIFLVSLILFYIGVLAAYAILIPVGFKFLINYSVSSSPLFLKTIPDIRLFVSLSDQIYLTQTIILIFAIIFQTPLFVLCLIKTGILEAKTIKNYRRQVIVICFFVAAILTPPDAVSMCLMALPLIFLFEVGLILNTLIGKLDR